MLNIYWFELSYFEIEATFDKFETKLIDANLSRIFLY